MRRAGAIFVLMAGALTTACGNSTSIQTDSPTSTFESSAVPKIAEAISSETDVAVASSTPLATAALPPPTPIFTPAPPSPTAAPLGFTFGEGKKIVGVEVVRGATYRTRSATKSCVYSRLSEKGERLITRYTVSPAVVTIGEFDAGFQSSQCGQWTQDLSAITGSLTAPIQGSGTWIVGVDIAPGTWATTGDGCFWARLSSFNGDSDDFIDHMNINPGNVVTIEESDAGFTINGCGIWKLQD